jgi:integrase
LDALDLPRKGARWYRDPFTTPLRLRASRRGATWVFHGRIHGQPRRQTLGKYPRVSLDQARAMCARIATESGAPAATPLTFSQLRLAYFGSAEFKRLADRTQRSYKWVLQSRDYEALAVSKIRDITRLDLLALKDKIAADGRAYQNILRPAQALFSWALDRGHIDVSPASRLKLPVNAADPKPYPDSDLGALLEAADKAAEPWRMLYLLVAHTGQRPSTWTDAKWSEIDLDEATLTVSRVRGRKTKLKHGWSIPLAEPVVSILRALRKRQGRNRNEWLFGRKLVVEQKVRDRIANAAGLSADSDRGTLHRFRSSMLAKFAKWHIPTEVQQRMAGHASPFAGSRGHYIPLEPTEEMRELAARYAEQLKFCRLLA